MQGGQNVSIFRLEEENDNKWVQGRHYCIIRFANLIRAASYVEA